MSDKVKEDSLEKVSGGNGQSNPKFAIGDFVFVPGSMSQSLLHIESVGWSDIYCDWYYGGTRRYANGTRDKRGACERDMSIKAEPDSYQVIHFWD